VGDTTNQRRLVAILAADVAGYTKLVEQDTDGTVAAWKAARDEVIKPLIDYNAGRIIKFTGDGFLAEFPSVQDGVACAISLQEQLMSSPLDFRMGVNVGDITDDGGDVHGEGVNIAARLEALADSGGICISGDVYNQVRNRINTSFNDMGEQQLKHVSEPVRVYAINVNPDHTPDPTEASSAVQDSEKTSIAVLPFDNMSNDPEQEYFCDGVIEDIITELSKFRWLKVIARNSTFAYKGQSVDIKVIGQELGARYVVEGSVRKSGNRIRINAQLIDSSDGSHVWAERFDRELTDIFDLQDEITQTLVSTIEPELSVIERDKARRKPTESLDAWDLYQHAVWNRFRYSKEGYAEAERLLKEALSHDPNFAAAYALLGWIGYVRVIIGHTETPEETLSQAFSDATKSIFLDNRDATAYSTLASIQTQMGLYDAALKGFDYAIELNPNFAQAYIYKALTMMLSGACDGDAIKDTARTGMKLSPKDPASWTAYTAIGFVQMFADEYEAALATYEAACHLPVTTYYPYLSRSLALKLLDRSEEAEVAMAKTLDIKPDLTWAKYAQQVGRPLTAMMKSNGMMDALVAIGLPEK